MAALRRKDLVKDGKYNRAEVMKRAWMYTKNPFSTEYRGRFKSALRAAWIDARLEMERQSEPDTPPYFNKNVSVADIRPHGRANGFAYGW